MLDDWKFYYPINSSPSPQPTGPSFRRITVRHWMPIGADEYFTVDTNHPYVGDHTPTVELSPREAHGFQQSGLAVRKGKSYTSRIVPAGSPGTIVKVSLIWAILEVIVKASLLKRLGLSTAK